MSVTTSYQTETPCSSKVYLIVVGEGEDGGVSDTVLLGTSGVDRSGGFFEAGVTNDFMVSG